MFDTLTRMGASAAGAYEIERSLKFYDTGYLDRTQSGAGNSKTWTVSFWMKLAKIGVQHFPFSTGANGSNRVQFAIENSHKVNLECTDGGSTQLNLISDRLFRDITSWYHFVISVDTTQNTSSNRGKIYVNGEQLTDFSTETYPNQNDDLQWNKAAAHYIGKRSYSSHYADGYIADFHSVDGTALTPSSFGETDDDTGEWIPKEYTGSYGTNGFYLDFSDNSNTTSGTLGADSSGNGHNFTPNNFSVAAGVGNDSTEDTPTNNWCTFNPLHVHPDNPFTLTEGNLKWNGVSGNHHLRSSMTMPVRSGKWYVEFTGLSGYESTDGTTRIGMITANAGNRDPSGTALWYENTNGATSVNYGSNGSVYEFDTATSVTGLSTFENDDVMGIALDLDNDKLFISKNGTWFSNGTGTQDPAAGTNPVYSGGLLTSRKAEGFEIAWSGYDSQTAWGNFGSQGFTHTPPTGFKAICAKNLDAPAIKNGREYFKAKLYTGTGNTNTNAVTGIGFAPDLVWCKDRTSAYYHGLWDTVRGVSGTNSQFLVPSQDFAEGTGALNSGNPHLVMDSLDSNGFTLGTTTPTASVNHLNDDFVAWNWKESASAGFDMVPYTGDGTNNRELSHGLNVAPEFYIIKSRSEDHDWNCWHSGVASGQYGALNSGNAFASDSGGFMHGAPTSSVLKLGTWQAVNKNTVTYIAYCFASVEGYCKIGKYIGNNSTDGPYLHLGFRPAFVMVKNASTNAEDWEIWDNARDPYNVTTKRLKASSNGAEASSTFWDFVSTGLKARNTSGGYNNNGDTFLYIAFAESPFKYSNAL